MDDEVLRDLQKAFIAAMMDAGVGFVACDDRTPLGSPSTSSPPLLNTSGR
jgi:hypothetical protein